MGNVYNRLNLIIENYLSGKGCIVSGHALVKEPNNGKSGLVLDYLSNSAFPGGLTEEDLANPIGL